MSLVASPTLLVGPQKHLDEGVNKDQSEGAEPCTKTDLNRETNLSDLPTEILEKIFQHCDYLSHLSEEELIIFHTLGDKFARVARCHLPKRKLCFNECYNLKTEDLLHTLSYQDKPVRVNIDDCYWLPSSVISHLINSVPLQELRVINFDLSFDDVKHLLQLELTKLSMKWTPIFSVVCQQNADHSVPLWTTLKSAKVLFKQDASIQKFANHFLCHCPNLEKLTVTKDKTKIKKTVYGFLFRNLDPELAKKFNNAVNVSDLMKSVIAQGDAEIKYEFLPEEKHSTLIPNNVSEGNKTFSINHREYKTLAEGKYCCKKIKTIGLMPKDISSLNFWELAQYVTQRFRALNTCNALNLQPCKNMKLFPTGLQLITGEISHLTYLDITMASVELTDEDKELVIEGVSRLKDLKTLFMNAYFVSFSPTNGNVDKFIHLSGNAIENSSMGLLTNCCKHISFLKLVGNINTNQNNELVLEANLAAISKLEHLLELHLIDILTMGKGDSLALITKGCTKLRVLQLKYIALYPEQKSIEECFLHTKSIKEIHIYQKIELSEQLINNLSGCIQLEKLGLEGVTASLDQLGYLNNKLLTMENLHVLRLVTQNAIDFPTSLMWNLALINDSKPAFRYVLRNLENMLNDNINLIERQWPPVHQNMFQYSSSKRF